MDDSGKQVQLASTDELIVARVVAIDVAQDSCRRVPPSSPRRRTTTVWKVQARTDTIMNLAEQLAGEGIDGSCSNRPRSTGARSTNCSKHGV